MIDKHAVRYVLALPDMAEFFNMRLDTEGILKPFGPLCEARLYESAREAYYEAASLCGLIGVRVEVVDLRTARRRRDLAVRM
jgi:hypothetical protein